MPQAKGIGLMSNVILDRGRFLDFIFVVSLNLSMMLSGRLIVLIDRANGFLSL